MIRGMKAGRDPAWSSTWSHELHHTPRCHSSGTWERHQVLHQGSVIFTVRKFSQLFNPLFPCFIKSPTFIHLIWFSPGFISWIFVLLFLPGSHVQCCQFLCPCRCRQISIKSKLQNWRIANLISKAISDWGPFGGIRSKTNKQTRFFFSTQIDFFFTWQYPFQSRIFYQILILAVMYSSVLLFPFSLLLTKLRGLAKENLFFYNRGECIAILVSLAACVFHNLTDAAYCDLPLCYHDSHFADGNKITETSGP